jgi:hypothetical protein
VDTFTPTGGGGGGGGGSPDAGLPVEPPQPVLTITDTRAINKKVNAWGHKERKRAAM